MSRTLERAVGISVLILAFLVGFTLTRAATTDNDGKVIMTWQPNAEPDLAEYHVYRLERVGTVIAPRFVDYNTHHGRDYRYAVTALDALGIESGLSAFSDVVQIRVGSLPPRLSITESADGIAISVAPGSVQ